MALSLYSVTVPAFQQTLTQIERLIGKAEAHCAEHGLAPEVLIQARLAPDMLPFAYQVKSTAVHSHGAIDGVRRGTFAPDKSTPPDTFAGLRERIVETLAALGAVDPAELDALSGQDMRFIAGPRQLEFTAENFLLSFTLPNFYFHATTAYDILRANGVAIGKVDYLGRPRIKG